MARRALAMVSMLLTIGAARLPDGFAAEASDSGRPMAMESIGRVFAAYRSSASPGCAVEVLKDGHMLYSRGFGMADLEHDVPIAPDTVFHVASLSKQFTAFAIYLLAQDGKLSLDDDVRKYLPQLHAFGPTITIRHLLHHTSGLRDQWSLLAMAGWRLEDVITEQDILGLVWRQKELNFAPGDAFLYSNTGYTLLGAIVERVSGKPLRAFTEERIFKPLGMARTQFHDDYGILVKNRANSYAQQPDGSYRYIALSYSNAGATSLFTTVQDLALWDENFYTGRVGGRELLAQMQLKGRLTNNEQINYASGLEIGEYRGLRTVEHEGADAGFRSALLRFPNQHGSVIVLCNAAQADPARFARDVSDIVFKGDLHPKPKQVAASHPAEVKIDPNLLDAYVGEYVLQPDFVLTFTREGDQLMGQATGQPQFPFFPFSSTGFFLKVVDAQVQFEAAGDNGRSAGVTLHQDGHDARAPRLERIAGTPTQLQAYTGTFYSDELDTIYTVSSREGKLWIRTARGEFEAQPVTPDIFSSQYPLGTVHFACTEPGHCDEFTVSDGRVMNLRFARVNLQPANSP